MVWKWIYTSADTDYITCCMQSHWLWALCSVYSLNRKFPCSWGWNVDGMIQYCPEGSLCRVQTSRMLMKLLDLAHEALYLKKSKGRGPAPDPSGIYCEFSVSLVNIDLIQVLSTQHTLFTVNHLYRCTTKGTMAGQWSWKQTTSTYELWRKQHRRITF